MMLAPLNIIYINSHDTGRYIQPYGHAIQTPNLLRLAKEGVLFRQAFSVAPTCSPSRASLCTGQYPHVCGMVGLGNRGIYPFRPEDHIAHFLKQLGYTTASWGMGDNHLGMSNIKKDFTTVGYETYLGTDEAFFYHPGVFTFDCLADYIRQPRAKPFFLSISDFLTHRKDVGFSTDRKKENDPRYVMPPATLGDTPEIREDWAHFCSDAETLDTRWGKIFDAVDQAGLKEKTLIIATTDHGVPFPGMKCNLTVHGCGVFLIMRGPGGFTGGKVVDGMISQLDLWPTICELIGVPSPERLQGTSLLPLVKGIQRQVHEEIFAEVSYHASYEPMRAVRTPRWVYVRRFGESLRPVLSNCAASISKSAWLEHGCADQDHPREMLFDTFFDPCEMNNLVREPSAKAILQEMQQRLNAWMQKTNDPLLVGQVPLPITGWENPRDGMDADNLRGKYPETPRR